MKHCWLNKAENSSIILFFNGWGMDEYPFKHLSSSLSDVITFYDYNSLNISDDLINTINEYKKINIIGWSMGVWAANNISDEFHSINKAVAINGTLKPIDDKYGIPLNVYNITLKRMSELARKKFFQRMFIARDDFKFFLDNAPLRDISNQIDELYQLKNYIEKDESFKNIYDSAIIGTNDKIIPSQNQKNFWQNNFIGNQVNVHNIEGGHYIFFNEWNSWEDILKYD